MIIASHSPSDYFTQKIITHRADYIDKQIKKLVNRENDYIVLTNLGGGLCSRFDRVKNDIVSTSIHLDLAEVIELVKKPFPRHADYLLSGDLNDSKWLDEVDKLIAGTKNEQKKYAAYILLRRCQHVFEKIFFS